MIVAGRVVTPADRAAALERLDAIGDRALRRCDEIEEQIDYWARQHRAEDIVDELRAEHRALHRRLAFVADCRRATMRGGRE